MPKGLPLHDITILQGQSFNLNIELYIYKSQNEADLEIRGKIIEYNKNNALCDCDFLS
jgi:hypothetical protein